MLAGILLLGGTAPAWAQAGKSGALNVTAANTIMNEYTALAADVSLGSTTITINSTGSGTTLALLNANERFGSTLQAGDLLLIESILFTF